MVRKKRQGKIVNLEIQSHGKPGTIVVPGGDITTDNVHQFGGMLRAVMVSGGLIEVMACNVASFGAWTSAPPRWCSAELGDNWDGDGLDPKYTTDHVIMRDYDRFGDWEGPVWDFLPTRCACPSIR